MRGMESNIELERAFRALQIQLDEGIDEWILPFAQSRFDEAKAATLSQNPPTTMPAKPASAIETAVDTPDSGVDFETLKTDEAVIEALLKALPDGLKTALKDPLPALGREDAEIAVVVDPPFREAVAMGSLEGDASVRLLRKSLQAVHLDYDASAGKEPRALLRIIPISPWRIPQDRKFMENEAAIFKAALRARLRLGAPKIVLIAGSNLGGLEEEIKDTKLFDLPTRVLISPRIMLREPLLKKLHWQRLLELHAELDGILKL